MEENNNAVDVHSMTGLMKARIADTASRLMDIGPSHEFLDTVSARILALTSEELELSVRTTREVLPILLGAITQMAEMLSRVSLTEDFVEISCDALETFRELSPFVPEEAQEEFAKIVAPVPVGESRFITFDRFVVLLSLLLQLIQLLLPTSFDQETREILHERNEIEHKQAELAEDQIELFREFFNYIEENGIDVSGQIETIEDDCDTVEENAEITDDLVVLNSQDNNASGQRDNHDLQP